MSEIVWEDPPPLKKRGRESRIEPFMAELKKHPGKWAIYDTGYSKPSYGGVFKKMRDLGCEVAMRRADADGTFTAYARWPEASDG